MDDGPTQTNFDQDLTLRAWDGDESVLAELVVEVGLALETAMSKLLPNRLKRHAEDVVCEAIARFWSSRDQFDGTRSLRAYLYRIAQRVAFDLKAGKLKWQKSANRERILDQSHLEELPGSNEPQLDDLEEANKGLTKAVQESLQELSPIERDVIEAFGCADDHELNAAQLGVELGRIHANGVPIPKGTIRQHKLRGKNKLIAKLKKRGYDIDNLGDKA